MMANALCLSCGKVRAWRATRGARLSDLRCSCGGELRGMTAGRRGGNAGKHYMICRVCGRHRINVLMTTRDWPAYDGKIIPTGTVLCGHHDVRVPDEQFRGGWRSTSVRMAEAYHRPSLEEARSSEV